MKQLNLFRKLLFAYTLFAFVQSLPILDLLYDGTQNFIPTQSLKGYTLTTLFNLLSVDCIKPYYMWFIVAQQVFALAGLLGFFPRISSFVVFFTSINLQNRIYTTTTGGDILLYIMFFYLSFISGGKPLRNPVLNDIQNAFDRVFIFLCKAQVIIVYAVSAIYKLNSPEWVNGTALQSVLSIDEYSISFLRSAVWDFPFLFKLVTWFSLLYQILFPFMIWFKKVKNHYLLVGVIMHIFIAIGMGIFNFSLVMICCYALFYERNKPVSEK